MAGRAMISGKSFLKLRFTALLIVFVMYLWLGMGAVAQISEGDISALRAQGQKSGWTFNVGESSATQYSIDELCGLFVPDDWWVDASFTSFPEKAALPESFDWRDQCPPVKAQGGCGSCWAFATVGTLECAISIRDGDTVDLSEQWLVSCNTSTAPPHLLTEGSWGCAGGWFAHDYHDDEPGACGQSGAVFESESPYEATDLPCGGPHNHQYRIGWWSYIGGEEGIPATDDIKRAIMQFGPVTAAVYSDSAFSAYKDGVFNTSSPDEVNHAIVLVGWDDTKGANGAWILRNSWGPDWGLDGYMYIEYGCSSVGFAANFIMYPPPAEPEAGMPLNRGVGLVIIFAIMSCFGSYALRSRG